MKEKIVSVLVMIVLMHSVCEQNKEAPWKSIFNGKNFAGWKMVGEKAVAMVQNGEIVTHRVIGNNEHSFVQYFGK